MPERARERREFPIARGDGVLGNAQAGTNALNHGLTRNFTESVGPMREEGGSQPDRWVSAERPQAYLTGNSELVPATAACASSLMIGFTKRMVRQWGAALGVSWALIVPGSAPRFPGSGRPPSRVLADAERYVPRPPALSPAGNPPHYSSASSVPLV